jgi:lactoylglutathione lyase
MQTETLPRPSTADKSSSAPLRIAVASSSGNRIDQHFGQTEIFRVYDVSAGSIVHLEDRDIANHAQGDEDRRDTICRMLADCRVLLVAKIGIAPQEKLAGVGVEASDLYAGKAVDAALADVYAAKAAVSSDAVVDTSDFRMLHAMLRVSDLERSLDFYTRQLGMTVLERRDHKKNQFSQVYLGYGAGFAQMAIELVQNWSQDEPLAAGNAFGHIAIGVKGITALCDRLAAAGVPMPRPPRSQRHGDVIVAFIEDPDGHRIELVQTPTDS